MAPVKNKYLLQIHKNELNLIVWAGEDRGFTLNTKLSL